MPAIVVIMCLVIGITITIGVRERWTEMAVLKVLGFQPWQIMGMIVSEAMLIGVYGGMLSTWTVYYLPKAISAANKAVGGSFKFFDNWESDPMILVYGPILGLAGRAGRGGAAVVERPQGEGVRGVRPGGVTAVAPSPRWGEG